MPVHRFALTEVI